MISPTTRANRHPTIAIPNTPSTMRQAYPRRGHDEPVPTRDPIDHIRPIERARQSEELEALQPPADAALGGEPLGAGGPVPAGHRKSVSFFLDAPSFGSRFAWHVTHSVA